MYLGNAVILNLHHFGLREKDGEMYFGIGWRHPDRSGARDAPNLQV
jgi:hypothetical protein